MPGNQATHLHISFGPFEADLQTQELRKWGVRLRLPGQSFQILRMLLERAGDLVSREELHQALWPADTFVDFEKGINAAINRLREALGDSAEEPRYVETLPRRGYRFLAAVERGRGVGAGGRSLEGEAVSPAPRIDSLAVLPLENLSGDPAQEYFSDGMTEELISAISKISSLRVISRTSVMRYRGIRKSLPAIAKELRVDAIVEGSVARSEGKVRITAQLIHAADDRHLWSGRYERELRDVLQLQAEIAENIAGKIHRLVDPAQRRVGPARKVHPQAYEAFLRGCFFRDKMNPVDLDKSVGYFLQAIELDPGNAPAYAILSQVYFHLGVFGMGPASELFLKARANAEKALELDETVGAAHNGLAAVHILYDWDWIRAEERCLRAMQLNPSDSATRLHLADYMSIQARHDEAVAEFKLALELNPISCFYVGFSGLLFYRARRYDEAIAECLKALEIDPYYPNAMWFLALALEQKGQLAESIAQLEKAVGLSRGSLFRALLARAWALAGERTRAESMLEELKELSRREYVSPFDIAVVYAGLGERDAAFAWLETAYQQRVFRIIELTMPMFDDLRADARWQDLVRRIGLPI